MPTTTELPMRWPRLDARTTQALTIHRDALRDLADYAAEREKLPEDCTWTAPDGFTVRVSCGYGFLRIGYGPRFFGGDGSHPLDADGFAAFGVDYGGQPINVWVYDDPDREAETFAEVTDAARRRLLADAVGRAVEYDEAHPDARDARELALVAHDARRRAINHADAVSELLNTLDA